ncbi:MAG: hypothetical protein WC022_00020 [Parcubacteria group bacterium]
MRICIITDNKNSHASCQFEKELSLAGHKPFFASWKNIYFEGNTLLLDKKVSLKKFDAVIVRASSTSATPLSLVLDYCIQNNIRLLNKTFYLRYQTIHKLRQQSLFEASKIPCLKTIYGENESYSSLKKTLGASFVAKLANGSLGKQVFKITSKKEFDKFIGERKRDKKIYLFQKFYSTTGDFRVFVIGKKVFGPVKRIAPKGEWRTNVRGASHMRADKKEVVLKLAKLFAKKTDIEFAGIDILIDSSQKPRIIEINTMADFKVFDKIYPEIKIARETIRLLQDSLAQKTFLEK